MSGGRRLRPVRRAIVPGGGVGGEGGHGCRSTAAIPRRGRAFATDGPPRDFDPSNHVWAQVHVLSVLFALGV